MFYYLEKMILFVCISVFVVSCDEDDNTVLSDTVATGQMYATFQVVSDGGETVYAEAQLTKGVTPAESDDDELFVRLVGSDELWFSAGESINNIDFSDDLFDTLEGLDDTQARFNLSRSGRVIYDFIFFRQIINTFGTWYSATLPRSEEQEYRVVLLRKSNDIAENSQVVLPDDFSIVSPSSGAQFSRGSDDILVEWSMTESDVTVDIEVNITCPNTSVQSYSSPINSDTGSFVISAGELALPDLVGTCSTTLNVRKVRVGQFDPRFVGGAVNGYQIRRVVLTTGD